MNIFEDYFKKTNDLIYKNQKLLKLSNLNNLKILVLSLRQ